LTGKLASLPASLPPAEKSFMQHFDRGGQGPYHARAMGNPLQVPQTPLELAESSQVVEISGKIRDFGQLVAIAEANLAALEADRVPENWRNREIRGELRFGFVDAQRRVPAVSGHLAAALDAVCQRCLEPFVLPLRTELRLVFGGEQAYEKDGEVYEVWELDGERLSLEELVQEALIMTIPFVTMHVDDASCPVAAAASEEKENMTLPFANLKAQMQRKD
jgi:uncharacterized protein